MGNSADRSKGKTFLVGVLAGTVQKIVCYPLEVSSIIKNVTNQSIRIWDLGRGFRFALWTSSVKNGCNFLIIKNVKQLFPQDSQASAFVGGAASGAFEILWNPLMVIKQELQTGKSKNSYEVIQNRKKDSYFNGWKAMFGRNIVSSSFYYGSYILISDPSSGTFHKMLQGGVLGVWATILGWPWEYVRGQQSNERTKCRISGLQLLTNTQRREGIYRIIKVSESASRKQFLQGAILAPFISYILCDHKNM